MKLYENNNILYSIIYVFENVDKWYFKFYGDFYIKE